MPEATSPGTYPHAALPAEVQNHMYCAGQVSDCRFSPSPHLQEQYLRDYTRVLPPLNHCSSLTLESSPRQEHFCRLCSPARAITHAKRSFPRLRFWPATAQPLCKELLNSTTTLPCAVSRVTHPSPSSPVGRAGTWRADLQHTSPQFSVR